MCGFAGVIAKEKFHDPLGIARKVEKMSGMLRHRGPDDSQLFQNDWLCVGFNRLSIIDLEPRSNQPMLDSSKRFLLVYNGEVYNYIELREELKAKGIQFKTESDTEVVLNALICWKEEALNKFEGMFSFLFFDLKERSFLAGRDNFGIKPLYYLETKDFIAFSSEVKSFLALRSLVPNRDTFSEYLIFRFSVSEETMFQDVYQVLPGHYLSKKRGQRLMKQQYYEIKVPEKQISHWNEKEILDELEGLLRQSVKLHTRCNVPYGVQLSGGVDSSIVSKYVSELKQDTLHSYSISFPGYDFDESKFQNEVIAKLGTKHRNLAFEEKNLLEGLEKCLWHFDFPIHDPNNIAFHSLCELASKDGIKVLLSGDGADEVFCGYQSHLSTQRFDKSLKYSLLNSYTNSELFQVMSKYWPKKLLPKSFVGKHPVVYSNIRNNPYLVSLLAPSLKSNYQRRWNLVGASREASKSLSLMDCYGYLQPWLMRADRMGLAASVELRVPFCNRRLLEKVLEIPTSLKLKEGKTKYLLKKITEKYFSNDLVWRKKVGFCMPVDVWFRSQKGLGQMLDLLTDQKSKERELFDCKLMERMIEEHRSEKSNHSRILWSALMLELWHRQISLKQAELKVA